VKPTPSKSPPSKAAAAMSEHLFDAEHDRVDALRLLAGFQFALALGLAEHAVGLRVGELDAVRQAHLVVAEAAAHAAQVVGRTFGRPVFQVHRAAQTLALDGVAAALELLQVVAVPGAAGLDVVRAEAAPLGVEAERDAELAVGKAVGPDQRAVRAGLARQVAVVGAEFGRQQPALDVESRQRLDVDRAADRVGVHVGRQCLDHLQRADQR
jgi:hypothetical protein